MITRPIETCFTSLCYIRCDITSLFYGVNRVAVSISRRSKNLKESVLALVTTSAIANVAWAAEGPPPVAPPTPEACTSLPEFVATACPLTWHGITIYGAYDIGAGWVSHGLPENGYNYEGESLVNRNGDHSQFLIAPNNLQQTGLGIMGKMELLRGWYAVFNASTGINPQSGQLANMAATNTSNNGLPRVSYSATGDLNTLEIPFNMRRHGQSASASFGRKKISPTRLLL